LFHPFGVGRYSGEECPPCWLVPGIKMENVDNFV